MCCDQWRGLHCVPIMECCLLVVPDTLSPHNVAPIQTINPQIRREQFPSLPVELSTNLREISQCPEKVSFKVQSAYYGQTMAFTIIYGMDTITMIAALPIFDIFTGKQTGNIFCLNDQPNIACFMIIRGV